MLSPILIASFSIMFASLAGVVFTAKVFKGFFEKNMGLLVSFSSGVFVVIVFGLLKEVFEHSEKFTEPLGFIVAGVLGAVFLFKFLPGFHHHHDESHEDHTHSRVDARKIVFSDAIHNIGDGILLVSSFAVSLSVGIAVAFSIFVHELIQEISQFFVLRSAGFSVAKSLWWNLLASSTVLVGSVGGFFLLESFEQLEVPLLAVSAGAFLVVIVQDLIPESIRHSKVKENYAKHILVFFLGLALMFSVKFFFSH